jgi:hypothetical protein
MKQPGELHGAVIMGNALQSLSEEEFSTLYGKSKEEVRKHTDLLEQLLNDCQRALAQDVFSKHLEKIETEYEWLRDTAKIPVARGVLFG